MAGGSARRRATGRRRRRRLRAHGIHSCPHPAVLQPPRLPIYLSTYLLVQFPTPSGPYGNALKLTLVFQSRARRLHLHDLSCRAASRTLLPPRVCCSAHADGQARLRDLTRTLSLSLFFSLSLFPLRSPPDSSTLFPSYFHFARKPGSIGLTRECTLSSRSVLLSRALSRVSARVLPPPVHPREFIAEGPYPRARASAADVPSRFPQPVSD